jgi:hypothetical protein
MVARYVAARRSLRRQSAQILTRDGAIRVLYSVMSHSRFWPVAATLCLACGSTFESGGSAGAGGTVAAAGTTSVAGTSAGGTETGAGGTNATGGVGVGGSATAGTGTGGAATGGASAGGTNPGGSAGAADCATLKTEYAAAVEKARTCDSGSTDECDKSSTLPAEGCGCPTLVNAKSQFTADAKAKYQAIQDAKCSGGLTCNIACLGYTSAACAVSATAAGTAYVCTGTQGGIAQ